LIVLVLGLLKWRGINHVCWCTFSSEVNIFTILSGLLPVHAVHSSYPHDHSIQK
jgi:hypothetical protein